MNGSPKPAELGTKLAKSEFFSKAFFSVLAKAFL